MSRKTTIGKREARRLLWERLAQTAENEQPIDWTEDDTSVPRNAEGEVTEATLFALEEAAEDIAAYIRRRFLEPAPKRTRR